MNTPAFQHFQAAFGRHLRDPHHTPRPAGVPARRMAVYNELLFNNVTGFLDACFPVCRAILGEVRWRRLNRTFFRDWSSQTPWFRDIPREFVRYLQGRTGGQPLPAWFAELAHYEWAELAVDTMEVAVPLHDTLGDLRSGCPLANPALLCLTYAWPVHRIGPAWRPRKPQTTHLLVFRDTDERVRFAEINPVTARLLELLAGEGINGEAACHQIAAELAHPDPQAVLAFGLTALADLRQQGAIIGTRL